MKRLLLSLALVASTGFAATPGLLVTKIKHGDYWISIYSTKNGPRYDVNRPDGELVAENASVDQLEKKVPDVYHFVKRAIAFDAGNGKNAVIPIIDAGVEQ